MIISLQAQPKEGGRSTRRFNGAVKTGQGEGETVSEEDASQRSSPARSCAALALASMFRQPSGDSEPETGGDKKGNEKPDFFRIE